MRAASAGGATRRHVFADDNDDEAGAGDAGGRESGEPGGAGLENLSQNETLRKYAYADRSGGGGLSVADDGAGATAVAAWTARERSDGPLGWTGYRWFVVATASLHGVTAIAVGALTPKYDWPVRVCASYASWAPANPSYACGALIGNTTQVNVCQVVTKWKYVGTLSPYGLLTTFSALSCVAQLLPASRDAWWRTYARLVRVGVQPLRWIEFAWSAPCMVTVLLILNGNYDLWIYLTCWALTAATMLFGALHEFASYDAARLRKLNTQLATLKGKSSNSASYDNNSNSAGLAPWTAAAHAAAHASGWVPFAASWTVIAAQFTWELSEFADSAKKHGLKFPKAVQAIIWVQFFMFALFGFNQLFTIIIKKRWPFTTAELVYTTLSLTAKQLLVWLLVGGVSFRGGAHVQPVAPC